MGGAESAPSCASSDPAATLARLSAALGLMQDQADVLHELLLQPKSAVALRQRAGAIGTQLREYVDEMDAIFAYCERVRRDVPSLRQDEVAAIARRAGWLP